MVGGCGVYASRHHDRPNRTNDGSSLADPNVGVIMSPHTLAAVLPGYDVTVTEMFVLNVYVSGFPRASGPRSRPTTRPGAATARAW